MRSIATAQDCVPWRTSALAQLHGMPLFSQAQERGFQSSQTLCEESYRAVLDSLPPNLIPQTKVGQVPPGHLRRLFGSRAHQSLK